MAKHQPIDEVRIGSVKTAIWRNETDNGARFNVTFQRLYLSDDGWKSTVGFGRNDLLTLAKVANAAHSRIYELQQEEQ